MKSQVVDDRNATIDITVECATCGVPMRHNLASPLERREASTVLRQAEELPFEGGR